MSNEEAIAFYKKYGFEVTETVAGYYKRLTPADAHVLSRPLAGLALPPGLLALDADDAEDRTLDAP